ncbi:hypothetical protein J3T99_04790 [Acetobacteraceae bacterium B3987]|nr:hypothetical protein [Acetobacteraceae bacterium B3987]
MTAGLPASLRRDGQPIRQLYPGWHLLGRHWAPAGLDVLILHHEQTGQDVCWWLSPDGDLLACHALALDTHWSSRVMEAITPPLHRLSTTLLGKVTPLPEEASFPHEALAPLARLPHTACLQLLGLWFRTVSTELRLLPSAVLLEQDSTPPESDDAEESSKPFSPELIKTLLETRPAGPHTLTYSPFSGRIVRAELTMPMERGVACRFSDERNGQTFYLFWSTPTGSGESQTAPAPLFYHPQGQLLIGDGPLTPLVPVFLLSWFINHPHCIEELKHARPFRLEDYGVGRASALWEEITTVSSASMCESHEETGQNRTSFPFSSKLWMQSSILEAGRAAGLPERNQLIPQNHEKKTDAGHENHDES